MGSKKNVDMSQTETKVKVVETPPSTSSGTSKIAKVVKKQSKQRSSKYKATRAQVDKTKLYDLKVAIELIKKLSYSKFDASIEAHAVLKKEGGSYKLNLPHSTGKKVKVVIASDKVLKDIVAGKINFDVLIASKTDMPKLTKHARILGPKGLMPNPKNGTLTDNPEKKKKELEAGSMIIKTEKKAPLIHLIVGKTSMEVKDLQANLEALIKALDQNLVKLSISASMSPGVKVKLG
ncbi:MAG: hypothetical protein ABFQ62_02750 [Patescibacteria group bacterium]